MSSGWLLAISGAWSFVTITSPVPLFGAVRTGVTAVVYNALIGAAFLSMGLGLARKTSWALKATMFATVVYSLDKLLFMVDGGARRAAFSSEGGAAALLGPELVNMVDPLLVVFSAVFLLGWWGLALFVYLRRKDFPVAG